MVKDVTGSGGRPRSAPREVLPDMEVVNGNLRFRPNGKDSMVPRLRIYYGPECDNSSTIETATTKQETVSVPLGEVFPALMEALESGRTWPTDFADDEVTIPTDLYEVILAYQHYRRPSA